MVISIVFCDFALWNSDHRNLGLVFPKFLFFWAEWNAQRNGTKSNLSQFFFLQKIFISNKNHRLLGNPLILPQTKILISFWSQKAEKQKFNIEKNVMSEPVKMPVRHFLRRDYLHIFFYIKFLLFVSLVPQISILDFL